MIITKKLKKNVLIKNEFKISLIENSIGLTTFIIKSRNNTLLNRIKIVNPEHIKPNKNEVNPNIILSLY